MEASFSYRLVVIFFAFIRRVFFREVVVRGSHKIPDRGPVIFVAAPHCNQFVDPIILISTCKRPIGFLIAAVSLKRRIIGMFGRMLGSIPVVRAQDHSVKGKGRVGISPCEDEEKLLVGDESTAFLDQVAPYIKRIYPCEASIMIHYQNETYLASIGEVIDDHSLLLKKPFPFELSVALKNSHFNYSLAPIIDQKEMYGAVLQRLQAGKCVGIFPEGGSHDRAEMLPLKAGASIMSLAYESLSSGEALKIVPCGLNYFHADRFRSRALVEYGDYFEIQSELVEKFQLGGEFKKEAISDLLKVIADSLKAITINVPDFETLQIVQAARRLYRPEETLKKPAMQIELNRKFVKGYLKHRSDPRIMKLEQSILDYIGLLTAFGIKDHQVKDTEINFLNASIRLIYHLSIILIFGMISLPGYIINCPALYIIRTISKLKAKAAKKASSVKISGKDVISTWKLLVALVVLPILHSLYSIATIFILKQIYSLSYSWGKLVFLFFGLFYSYFAVAYLTIRLSELFMNSYHSIKPLIATAFNSKHCQILRLVRSSLRDQINVVVDELGPTVFANFEENRIVKNSFSASSSSRATSPLYSPESSLSSSKSSLFDGGTNSAGRSSPVFEENMESIENMLSQCKMLLMKKRKLE